MWSEVCACARVFTSETKNTPLTPAIGSVQEARGSGGGGARRRATSWVPQSVQPCRELEENSTHFHSACSAAAAAAAAARDGHIWLWDSRGKRSPGLRKRGGNRRRDRHCMFRSAAKTIAALESHVRGVPKASEGAGGRQRGQMAVQKWQIATLLTVPEKGALM